MSDAIAFESDFAEWRMNGVLCSSSKTPPIAHVTTFTKRDDNISRGCRKRTWLSYSFW